MNRDRLPVIVGTGQVTLRDQEWPDIREPVDLAAEAVALAARDSGAGGILDRVDSLSVAPILSWDYGNAPLILAERLRLGPGDRHYLDVGGNTPQRAVGKLAGQLARGEIDVAVLCGAECSAGKRRAKRSGNLVEWGHSDVPLGEPHHDGLDIPHASELSRSVARPMEVYPMFEPALRVAAGRTPQEHTRFIGEMLAAMTSVAAGNPDAWFRRTLGADEIMTPSEANRMTAVPYTLRCNSFMRVDMGAAVVLTTAGRAAELGIPEERWVYVWSVADCTDVWVLGERAAYDHSPAMRMCAEAVLRAGGVHADDVAHLDLYSCFPSAVQLATEALRIRAGDSRSLTVTGGMASFGGPWNDYVTHSIAEMAQRLRSDPGSLGLVTGNGGYVTKHSWGLYSTRPPQQPFTSNDEMADTDFLQSSDHPKVELEPEGDATLDGYTVTFDRQGDLERAIAICRLPSDRRCIATSADPEVASALAEGEWYGAPVRVARGGDLHLPD